MEHIIETKYHRHLGVFGICYRNNRMLVVHKTGGPYIHRFDLPGGTIEPNESIIEAIHREFLEETGYRVNVIRNAGVSEYIVKYHIRDCSYIQHIAIFLEVSIGEAWGVQLASDDTSGTEWVSLEEINEGNSSPLVLTAKHYIKTNQLPTVSSMFDDWVVLARSRQPN